MTPERWQKIEQIYHAALERRESERFTYLKIACDGDEVLRKEVESLLLHGKTTDGWLEGGALQEMVGEVFGQEDGRSFIGMQLGSYRVLSLIGSGGMGEVYEAFDTKLGRNVAIKVLPAAFVRDPNRLSRFQREAKMLASLNHPNIATIHGLEQSDGVHYLVMELVTGQTLAERLRAGPLAIKELLDLCIQVADALEAAHAQGVIHRDIKPANIAVTKRGQAKILDFGLAKLTRLPAAGVASSASMASEVEKSLSMPNTLLGTVAYMSPEQVRGEELDIRTDLFSFGLTIYEMATGSAAFGGGGVGVIFDAILNRQPVSPSQLNRAVSPKFEEIINRALEKDKKLRYQTAQDLGAELQRLKRDLESGTASTVGPVSVVRIRLDKRIGLLLGGVALVGIVLFLTAILQPRILKVTGSYPITTDGRQKELPGSFYPIVTDGVRLYFTEIGPGDLSFAQVSAAGGHTASIDIPFRFPRMADLSPDRAQLLLFGFAGSELESTLWIQPVLGGTPWRVGDLQGHDATWSPTGKILYANGSSLYESKQDGTDIRKLMTLTGIPFWPRWAPDGRVLRFSVRDAGTNSTSLWEVLPDGRNPHRLLSGWNDPPAECCGNWSSDGKYFAFQSSRNNQTNIWVSQENGASWKLRNRGPLQLTTGPINFFAPVFSGDGMKLFSIGEQRRGQLVRYDAKANQFSPYLSGISADSLDFSRNGEWIAYVSYPEETLWRSKIDGSQKQQLTFSPLTVHLPRWSPDGKAIAFSAAQNRKLWKIYLIPGEGGSPSEILPGNEWQFDPSWSEDGRFLVFTSPDLRQASSHTVVAIFVLDTRTHQVTMLPGSDGLTSPRWSPDGRYIAATTADSQKLLLFDTLGRTWSQLAQIAIGYLNWSKDSKYLYFDTFGNAPSAFRIGIHGGALEKVASLNGIDRAGARYGPWFGLGPNDALLATLNMDTQEVYAIQLSAQ